QVPKRPNPEESAQRALSYQLRRQRGARDLRRTTKWSTRRERIRGGCLPTQGNCTRLRAMVSVPEQRAESLFCCPHQSAGWMMIQGQDGDQTEARRLSRRVILGQRTTLGATDLLCHFYQRKPQA